MSQLLVDPNLCCGSGECIKVCPLDAIRLVDGKAVIDPDKCDLDGICIAACPQHAIHFSD